MKRHLLMAALAGVVVGAMVVAWGWWQWNRPGPLSGGETGGPQTQRVRIRPGMTLSAAADTLVERGLLRNRRIFLVGARVGGQARALRAGLYELQYGRSARLLLRDLVTGRAVQLKVTLPEGLSAEEIAARTAEVLGFDALKFLAVADSLVRQRLAAAAGADSAALVQLDHLVDSGPTGKREVHWCEGYLAPDTYHFAEGTSAARVAEHLVKIQFERLDRAGSGGARLSGHRLLTLASLVEAEARLPQERSKVAAVYSNRLQQGWRLEADPTVAYVLHKKGKRLYYKDLKVDSPYNTYRYRGLPPGPIGCPGPAALAAAAHPDSTSKDFYFVSDGAGGHVFSRTLQEHDAAVRSFRRIRDGNARR